MYLSTMTVNPFSQSFAVRSTLGASIWRIGFAPVDQIEAFEECVEALQRSDVVANRVGRRRSAMRTFKAGAPVAEIAELNLTTRNRGEVALTSPLLKLTEEVDVLLAGPRGPPATSEIGIEAIERVGDRAGAHCNHLPAIGSPHRFHPLLQGFGLHDRCSIR